MKTLVIFVSDIHFTGNKPESEGIVINAFLKDVSDQAKLYPSTNVFVLIGGDLVQSADDKEAYETLYHDFLIPLIRMGIPSNHIISVPGNHDIQRQWIKENDVVYTPLISQKFSESKFNNLTGNVQLAVNLVSKFDHYSQFVTTKLKVQNYNPIAFNIELDDQWSVFCLNTSLTSHAGLVSESYPGLDSDIQHLNIDTRNLYQWINENSKKKILLMHHPVEYLSEWSSSELRKLIKLNFDLVLTGHTHEQNILCNNNGKDSFIACRAPQLFTEKSDTLGYCLIVLEGDQVDKIVYREWFPRRNAFKAGLDFTEEDNGIITFEKKSSVSYDPICLKIEDKFKETMSIYGGQPLIWIDRFFNTERFDRSYRLDKTQLMNEDEILSNYQNIKIVTPAQYGLTSFAWHTILKLWKERREFGLFIDCELVKRGVVDKVIDSQLQLWDIDGSAVKRIIIDNWTISNKYAKQIITTITQRFPDIPIMILCPMLEKSIVESEYVTNSEFGFVNLYMAPLKTQQVRSIVTTYNDKNHIGQVDVVLKRLDDDIQNFNMHRTPLSCITLLEVFSSSFDENPVNRTAVIEKVLRIIFDYDKQPLTYRSLPDVKDCEFAMGYFCEQLIRHEQFYFSANEFNEQLRAFCNTQKITLDLNYLFNLLLRNHIICQFDTDLYGFRFAYWIYYFAAMRMTKSPEFAEFILSNGNYAHYPEVIEFYTGSDRTRNDAADIVIEDLSRISQSVHDKVGLSDNFNPFSLLKLKNEQVEKTIQQLEANLQKSKLPTEVKDAMKDREYNPSLPFDQSALKVLENYSVIYLQEIIEIASKTLRNSDYIRPEKKEKLLTEITKAWFETARVIYLMIPFLVKDGTARFDGFGLSLSEDFDKYKDDPDLLLVKVISALPNNLVRWYKDNLYSSKLSQLLYGHIDVIHNQVIKHLLECLIICEQPEGWNVKVRNYLAGLDSSSYFFGDTIDILKSMYANGVMSEADVARTKELILLAYTKMVGNDNRMRPGCIKNLKVNKILPQRNNED